MVEANAASKRFLRQVTDRICIGQNVSTFLSTKKFRSFQPPMTYHAFCDDFGPMNFESIAIFISMLDKELDACPSSKIVYHVSRGRRALTNAIFLLGSYLILHNRTSDEVARVFDWLEEKTIEPFRDATYSKTTFGLSLFDCWRGLEMGKQNQWVQLPTGSGLWGRIDFDEYVHLDDPLNADMHEIVPGKLVAFRGPRDVGPRLYSDDGGYRRFGPKHYLHLFRHIGVTTVIRLNEPEYDRAEFTSNGIDHHDLVFEDCTSPPPHIIEHFFDIVDRAPGVVAVHCMAGLGCTGTLIALYMMRSCGFAPREAMGWLRIVRPGCVIGEQQHFLCGTRPPSRCDATRTIMLAGQVAAATERRCRIGGHRCHRRHSDPCAIASLQ